jgi:hypothetical protein
MRCMRIFPELCARTVYPFSNSTRNIAFGRGSTTVPSTVNASSFGLLRFLLLVTAQRDVKEQILPYGWTPRRTTRSADNSTKFHTKRKSQCWVNFVPFNSRASGPRLNRPKATTGVSIVGQNVTL